MKNWLLYWFEQEDEKIVLDLAHLPYVGFIMLIIGISLFSVGFYYGKRQALDDLMGHIQQESFADKVYSSLCALYDNYDSLPEETGESSLDGSSDTQETFPESLDEKESNGLETVAADSSLYYFAQLIGFGAQKTADAYAKKVTQRGLSCSVQKRVAQSASGKKRIWYQVVTEPMKKESLVTLVQKIAREDHLKDIKIQECSTHERQMA